MDQLNSPEAPSTVGSVEMSEMTFNWDEEWNISFAGCGFRSIYYLGALSCILERVPQLVHGASKICGASSGCLVAAAVTVGIPVEQLCIDVLKTATEARKRTLGVFHPTFSLLRSAQDFLLERLPEDAHLRASGKLCVSLTRLTDGKNVLVSEFDSRQELIQVLLCSCFFPVYCGFVPPSYRGVRYMDGALSNNMPLFEQRNTITVAPFSGESDICPREGTFNFCEVHYGNVSIQVNTGNVHRVSTSFLPPRIQTLAEICQNGYVDALRFLKERNVLGAESLPHSLMGDMDAAKPACCELVRAVKESNKAQLNGHDAPHQQHYWLDHSVIKNLPVGIKKILCEACRNSHDGVSQPHHFLPVRVVLYLLTVLLTSMQLTFLLTKRAMQSGCAVICRLTSAVTSSGSTDPKSPTLEQHSSTSSDSVLSNQKDRDKNIQTVTSTNLKS
ncbi:hypothetical protein Q5P01_012842 [Channa striata]|uniref:triacylglycerol lipase n=1 Tax=Channa striata TaxID=64152 RepID=A0AA88MPE6_CHASR|nr:hypothetical protein Q5P01_012842 [Channa striata]